MGLERGRRDKETPRSGWTQSHSLPLGVSVNQCHCSAVSGLMQFTGARLASGTERFPLGHVGRLERSRCSFQCRGMCTEKGEAAWQTAGAAWSCLRGQFASKGQQDLCS